MKKGLHQQEYREHLEIIWVNHQSAAENEVPPGLLTDMMQGEAGRCKRVENTSDPIVKQKAFSKVPTDGYPPAGWEPACVIWFCSTSHK